MGFPHLSPALEESEPSAHLHLHETPALYKPSKGEGLEAYGMALGLCPSLLALSLSLSHSLSRFDLRLTTVTSQGLYRRVLLEVRKFFSLQRAVAAVAAAASKGLLEGEERERARD